MKTNLICLIICLLGNGCLAQRITLDEALRTGLAQRWELKKQAVNVEIAELENAKLKARWLPQVNASADLRWNTQIQTSVFKDAPFIPGGGDAKVKLGVPFNNVLSLQAEQKVFDGQSKLDRQLNQAQVQSQQVLLEQNRQAVKQAVTEAYFGAVLNREKQKLSAKALERAQANLEVGETRLKVGSLLQNDFDRLRLELKTAQLTFEKDRQNYELSLDNLTLQMASTTRPEPADELATLLSSTAAVEADWSVAKRPELESERISLSINELNRQKQLARLAPTVSAYGNYSVQQFNDNPNVFASGTWFPFNFVGLKLNIPLFDGRQTKLQANEYTLRQQLNRYNSEQLTATYRYEAQTALNAWQQAKLNLADAERNVALARQILETDRLRFDKGVLLPTDLKNSEYSLQNAENTYLSYLYDYLLATVRFRKATGTL